MTLPRNVRAIRALYLHQNVLLELNMQKSLVVNQIHSAHRLVKDRIVTHYAGTNADLSQSCV